jgi:hypothetical protein
MYPQTLSSLPNDGGGYVPYFYQSGLHQAYPLQAEAAPPSIRTSSSSTPESASLEALFQRADRTQTVEQVIARGYFAVPPSTDQAEAIITDKRHTARLGLDDVIGQIRRRYTIYEQNTEQIERSKCAAINGIYQHEAYLGPGSASSKQHYAKHKAIQKLYEQQNEERTTLWKDVSRLRLLLPETAQLYLGAARKAAILAAETGDLL